MQVPEGALKQELSRIPMWRAGEPAEVASLVSFLCMPVGPLHRRRPDHQCLIHGRRPPAREDSINVGRTAFWQAFNLFGNWDTKHDRVKFAL